MSQAQLYADVYVTITLWRHSGIAPATIRQQLDIPTFTHRPRWRDVRTFMLGWLAGRECHSLQRVG
jgi:hypothetical protein